jgi:hypothetical protein
MEGPVYSLLRPLVERSIALTVKNHREREASVVAAQQDRSRIAFVRDAHGRVFE